METAHSLLQYIQSSSSPYHTVETSKKILFEAGFTELRLKDEWKLSAGDYMVDIYGSTLMAFHIGKDMRKCMHIATGHTDFPAIRIKPEPMVSENGYGKLNVETYGGMILTTWMDRPLAMAGIVVTKGNDAYHPVTTLVDTKKPFLIIPHLAIHMNRAMNDGETLNRQKDLLPLATMMGKDMDKKEVWDTFLAKEVGCKPEDILSYELTLYPAEEGNILGLNNEFISSNRLDNLTSCKACLEGIKAAKKDNVDGLQCIALFDNEEVGSKTKQGGASTVLSQVLERIYSAMGESKEAFYADVAAGFMLSADVAHALHPNNPEKNDITNKPILNKGVALKMACSQNYAGDATAIAIIKDLCQRNNINHQMYVNRSDIPGGSTLGSIASAMMAIRTMDIGVPILAMHSARETMGIEDQKSIEDLMIAFLR